MRDRQWWDSFIFPNCKLGQILVGSKGFVRHNLRAWDLSRIIMGNILRFLFFAAQPILKISYNSETHKTSAKAMSIMQEWFKAIRAGKQIGNLSIAEENVSSALFYIGVWAFLNRGNNFVKTHTDVIRPHDNKYLFNNLLFDE
jgi:hypothetical protein